MTTSQEGEPTGAEPPDLTEGQANSAPEVGNYLAMLGWAADSFVHIVAMLILGWWAARQHPAYAAGAAVVALGLGVALAARYRRNRSERKKWVEAWRARRSHRRTKSPGG